MAHIVPFRVAAARRTEEVEAGSTEGAEIVVFPGVQRERHAEPAADMPAGNGNAHRDSKRDWLELPDGVATICP